LKRILNIRYSDPVIKSYQINDTQTGLKEIYPVI
jgi:hypothetical protein